MDTSPPIRQRRSNLLWRHPSTRRRIRVQLGKIGRIRTHMTGLPCASCGSTTYQVVLQLRARTIPETLSGRCIRCHASRDLDKAGLWDAVLFRYGLRRPDPPLPLS